MNCKVGIIAALERELKPLIQGWSLNTLNVEGRPLICYENEEVVAVFCGMGAQRAEQAARAVVEQYRPAMLVSAGLAGALMRSLKVGSIVLPNVIVDSASGTEYRCDVGGEVIGGGVLLTHFEIADKRSKPELVACFHALIVDMEAAGVAKAAQQTGTGFRCVKAVSDELEFSMPPLQRFVDAEGQFQTRKFVRWVSLRPQYWPAVIALGRRSSKAAHALCDWLRQNLAAGLRPARVVTLNGAEYSNN